MKNIGLILALLNTLAIAGVGGFYYYTKKIFKRPPITEAMERAKLEATQAANAVPVKGESSVVSLPPLTANLEPYQDEKGKTKSPYVSMKLSFEIRDKKDETKFNEALPVVLDQINAILSKMKVQDLNQVQGRYLFRSQIIDFANERLKSPIVTEIYFTEFMIQ
jgi:flagellar basal body-associated protein FliL